MYVGFNIRSTVSIYGVVMGVMGVKNESIEGKHRKEEFGDATGCAHHFSETQACARQERMEHASVLRRERLAYAQDTGTHTLPQGSTSCE